METLNAATLAQVPSGVGVPGYDRGSVSTGIVHFGAGNFHRAHQAAYCDALLNLGETEWGITGVSLRSPTLRDALAPKGREWGRNRPSNTVHGAGISVI